MKHALLAACVVLCTSSLRAQPTSTHRYEATDPNSPGTSSSRPETRVPAGRAAPRVIRVDRPGELRVEPNSAGQPGSDSPGAGTDPRPAPSAAAANGAAASGAKTATASAAGTKSAGSAKKADGDAGVVVPLPNGRSCTAPFLPAAFLSLPKGPGGALPYVTHFYDAKTFDWTPYGSSPRCLVSSGGTVTVVPLSANIVILPEGLKGAENDPERPRYVVTQGGNSTVFWPKGYVAEGTPGYRYWTDARPYLPPNDLDNMILECAGINCYWHATAPNGYRASDYPDSQARFQAWAKAGFPNVDLAGCKLDVRGEYFTWNGKVYCDGNVPGRLGGSACRWSYHDYCFTENTPGDPREGVQGIVRVAVGSPECTAAPREGYSHYKGTVYWKPGDPDRPEPCRSGMKRMAHGSIDADLEASGVSVPKSAAAAATPPAAPPAAATPAEAPPATGSGSPAGAEEKEKTNPGRGLSQERTQER